MAKVPDDYEQLLHGIQTAGTGGANLRSEYEARIHISLVREQVDSAERISTAAQKTADSLTRATWVLSFATVILAIATIVLVVVTVRQ